MTDDECVRQCVTCRQQLPRKGLLKLTVSRQGEFCIDPTPQFQGRSAYCCQTVACLAEALRSRKFQRTLKRAIPGAIVENLKLQLISITP